MPFLFAICMPVEKYEATSAIAPFAGGLSKEKFDNCRKISTILSISCGRDDCLISIPGKDDR
jgi:hypothetical protein